MKISRRRLTPEEEKKREEQDEMVTAAFVLSHFMFSRDMIKANNHQSQPIKKRKIFEEDDSKETLDLLLQWTSDTSKSSPEEIIHALGRCSKPIRKQLTESDVKEDQNRLMLGKLQVEKNFLSLLEKSEIPLGKEGTKVKVYGPDGKVHDDIMFKMWNDKTPVLTSGWNNFVAKYGLKMHCDFLTVSMFRHKETSQICFAIDSTRLPIKTQLSKRISKIAFKT